MRSYMSHLQTATAGSAGSGVLPSTANIASSVRPAGPAGLADSASQAGSTAATVPGAVMRKPVFRSSAIFPIFHLAEIRTRIAFLGYWMIKRGVPEIQAVVTLRTAQGKTLNRKTERITEAKAYRYEAADLLAESGIGADGEFIGSLEIEFFAARDLVFPYPAVVVQYYGPAFGTIVHTAQRVFNDAEDRDANLESMVPEAGFNIYADDDREPFFAFVNGCDEVRGGEVEMKFFNARGETQAHTIPVSMLAPYQTMIVYPDRHMDLQSFLGGEPGTAQIRFDVSWVFPRIVAGNMQRSRQGLSVTHTYYDTSGSSGSEHYWRETPDGWLPASLYVPVSAAGERYTNINFYPIYSPAELEIDLALYREDGSLIGTVSGIHRIAPVQRSLRTIALKPLAEQLGADTSRPIGANLIARPIRGSRLPARLKLGLDYGRGNAALPCNICKTMDVCNLALEHKNRSFHWAPVPVEQEDAAIWIVNSAPMNPYTRAATVEMTFYREQDTAVLTREIALQPNGLAEIRLSAHPELQTFFQGRMGWYTCVSSNPYVKSYYVSESRSGIVGGDHDF